MNITNFNPEKRDEIAFELERIQCAMQGLVAEARTLIQNEWPSELSHADAYVFGGLSEMLDNANPHNSSLESMREELTGNDQEPIEDFGEKWEDEDEDDIGTCYSCGHRGVIGAACTCCGGRGVYERGEGGNAEKRNTPRVGYGSGHFEL